jgi:hypothetical protein
MVRGIDLGLQVRQVTAVRIQAVEGSRCTLGLEGREVVAKLEARYCGHQHEANEPGLVGSGISRTTGVTKMCGVPEVREAAELGVWVGTGWVLVVVMGAESRAARAAGMGLAGVSRWGFPHLGTGRTIAGSRQWCGYPYSPEAAAMTRLLPCPAPF